MVAIIDLDDVAGQGAVAANAARGVPTELPDALLFKGFEKRWLVWGLGGR